MILGFLALAWVLGIAAAAFTGADPAAAVAAAALLAAVSFALRPRPATLVLLAVGVPLVFAAAWRYDAAPAPSDNPGVARLNDGAAVRFRALVDDEPQEKGSGRVYTLAVREVYIRGAWKPESGGVLLHTALYPEYSYGDLLEVKGSLEAPPVFEDFDYRDYLLRQGIGSLVYYPGVKRLASGQGNSVRAALMDARDRLSEALAEALPQPQSSLAAGILLGARSQLPADVRQDMQVTSTSHLVAVSGQNVTMLAGLVIALLTWAVGRRRAAWLALAAVLGYAVLVGGQPSVVRAAIMGSLYIIAIAAGRQNTAPIGLLLAAAVMTALDPRVVHDVSFQLSFAATLGLMTLAPPLRDRLEVLASRRPGVLETPGVRPLIELSAVTLSAIAFTLPISAITFHRLSLVAPLANLLAVPAFVAVAVTSAIVAAAGLVVPSAAPYLVWLAWPPAAYMIAVIRLCAGLPAASIELSGLHVQHAIAYYAALGAGVWLAWRRPLARPVQPPPAPASGGPTPGRLVPAGALAVILALALVFAWLLRTQPQSGRLSVTFLDVGQGDAALIQAPQGRRILVDGGPSGEALTAALGRQLPFYDRRLDLVVATHPQADHLGGLPAVLDTYDVGAVLDTAVPAGSAVVRAWHSAEQAHGLAPTVAQRGQTIDLGDGATLAVLNPSGTPDDPNNGSTVLRLTMGGVSFLLTADLEQEGEQALIRSGTDLRASILKVGHHGSATSSTAAFLQRVGPLVDVISVGAGNRFGHPDSRVVSRFQGDVLLRTDENGDITVSTDGEQIWIDRQREAP